MLTATSNLVVYKERCKLRTEGYTQLDIQGTYSNVTYMT